MDSVGVALGQTVIGKLPLWTALCPPIAQLLLTDTGAVLRGRMAPVSSVWDGTGRVLCGPAPVEWAFSGQVGPEMLGGPHWNAQGTGDTAGPTGQSV